MDVKELYVNAVRRTMQGLEEAKLALKKEKSQFTIGDPTGIDVEYNMGMDYGPADFDEPIIGRIRLRLPLFKDEQADPAEASKPPGKKSRK